MLFCGCLFHLSANAQLVKPRDLKAARNAAYEWVNNYNVYAKCVGRNAQTNFYSLFSDSGVEIYNDYFPMPDYDFINPTISVEKYVELLRNKDNYYEMKYDVRRGTIQSEEYENGRIIFIVTFDKTVWFVQRGSMRDDRYEYPSQKLKMEVELEYNINNGELFAVDLKCKKPVSEFVVLHDEGKNVFEKSSAINASCVAKSTQLVHYKMQPMDFDPKMLEITSDTLSHYLGVGYNIGREVIDAPVSDSRFSNYNITGDLQQSIWVSFYQQILLNNVHHCGVEVSLLYKNSSSFVTAEFHERYNEIDPDGGRYERIVDGDNYEEYAKRHIIELPITFKYEYLFNRKLGAFAKAGASLTYDISRSVEASGNMEYQGYYDWLYNVTISQNGIYDFGAFPMHHTATQLGLKKISVGGIVSIGCCYYFLDNWMAELALSYRRTLWGGVNKSEDYHLSKNDGNWTSVSYIQDKYITSIFNFSLQINYNF